MKKYLILFMAVVSTSFFVGCDSDDDYNPPNYVTFASEEMDFTVDQNSSGSFDVTVYTANQVGSDRTFNINVHESSTISEGDYNVPETVTVPGNSNEATFTVEVTDNTIDDAGESLILTLSGDQGLYTGEPLEITVLKRCEFESLAPGYTASVSAFGVNAPQFDTTLNDEGGMVFTTDNLWGPEFVAWATGDPAYSGAFPYSATITMDANNNLTVTSEASMMEGGDGSYNPCTGTFTMDIETTLFGDPEIVTVVLTPNEGSGDTDGDTDEDDTDGDGTDD